MPNNTNWNKISKFEDADDSCGFLLWKTQLIWRRIIERALDQYNLTHTQFVILAVTAYLTRNDNRVTQVEIAKYSLCDINTTSQVLRTLVGKKLITRTNKAGNDKSKYPILTTLGYNTLKSAISSVESVDDCFFGSLNTEKLNIFKTSLIQLLKDQLSRIFMFPNSP